MKTKLSKKYYVPGIISAILIPLVFWYFGNRKLNEPIPNVMDLGIPAKLTKENYSNTFEPVRNWNYKKIIVKPGTAKQNSDLYVSEIKKMQKRNEKNSGIEFVLNDQNSYGDFASILNDLAITKHEIYAVDLDEAGHIFAVVDYKDPNKMEEPCELCNDTIAIIINDNYGFFRSFTSDISKLPKRTFYIIFGFLLFLNVAMLNIRKFL